MRLAGNSRVRYHVRLESLLLAIHNEMKLGADEIEWNCPRLLRIRWASAGEVITAMELLETDDHG